jgi:hypothetical protein
MNHSDEVIKRFAVRIVEFVNELTRDLDADDFKRVMACIRFDGGPTFADAMKERDEANK